MAGCVIATVIVTDLCNWQLQFNYIQLHKQCMYIMQEQVIVLTRLWALIAATLENNILGNGYQITLCFPKVC